MLEGKGKYYAQDAKHQYVIYVSVKLARDSQWPFHHKDSLKVRIDPENKQVIISKEEETNE